MKFHLKSLNIEYRTLNIEGSMKGFLTDFTLTFDIRYSLFDIPFCVRDSSGKPTAGQNLFGEKLGEDLQRIARPEVRRARPTDYSNLESGESYFTRRLIVSSIN